jgi:endoglucanase
MTKYRIIAFFAVSATHACHSPEGGVAPTVHTDSLNLQQFGFATTPAIVGALRDELASAIVTSTNPPAPDPSSDPPPPPPAPPPPAPPPSSLYTTGVKYRGINRAGAEYGDDWNGWTGGSYFEWPSPTGLAAELAYLDSVGFNTVRLPISWERLQHSLGGELNEIYATTLTSTVAQMTAAGFQVIVDLHNYNRYAMRTYTDDQGTTQSGGYSQHVLGDGTLNNSHLVDVWTRVASLFKSNARVAFELMNESHDFPITSDAYFALVNEQIAAVRATGAANLIIVPNSRGSDITHWTTGAPNGGSLDSVAALTVTDSANNYAYVVHQYDSSPASATHYSDMLGIITSWARTNGKRLFLTELGVVPSSANAQSAMTNLLQYMNDNSDVWLGWAPWNLTPYSITSASYTSDATAMSWYKPFLTPGIATSGK